MSHPPTPAQATDAAIAADIRVVPADATHDAALRALQVAPGQLPFVGDIAFNLEDAQRDRLSDAMAILADGAVIGFYRLDRAPRAVVGRRFEHPHLGLRAFLIDRQWQGRGYGTHAVRACCADACRRHPHHRWLALTVHDSNAAAIAMYTNAGFNDSGERVHGGAAGPQHLLLFQLHAFPHDLLPSLAQAPQR